MLKTAGLRRVAWATLIVFLAASDPGLISAARAAVADAPVPVAPTSKSVSEINRFKKEEAEIPQKPSAPPTLTQKAATELFHCPRYFLYKGRRYNCDSNLQRDGEGLRSVLQEVPDAVSELDLYQANRRSARTASYVASAGLLAALVGFLVARYNMGPDAQTVHDIGVYGGLSLATASFIYGFIVIKGNDGHLGAAVQNFNRAHPESPIELQFSTSF